MLRRSTQLYSAWRQKETSTARRQRRDYFGVEGSQGLQISKDIKVFSIVSSALVLVSLRFVASPMFNPM